MTDLTDVVVDSLTVGGVAVAAPTSHAYVAAGPIAETSGCVTLAKTVAGIMAMTLANPTADTDDFKVLHILNAQAQANYVTCTGGFGNGGSSYDVATFGAAVGNTLTVMAYQGYWYVIGAYGCTLG
jgi:hypothetical protein